MRPTFKMEITLGSLIQIAILVGGIILGWAKFDARTGATEAAIIRMERRQDKLDDTAADLRATTIRVTTLVDAMENSRRKNEP